jgi:hypothetical protein
MDLFLNIVAGIVVGLICIATIYSIGKNFAIDVLNIEPYIVGKFVHFLISIGCGLLLVFILTIIAFFLFWSFSRVLLLLSV